MTTICACNFIQQKKMNKPDKWVVVKMTANGETFYKLFSTWLGGYLDGDAWKINSGIVRVEQEGDFIKFFGHSGSCYECVNFERLYGTSGYTQGVLDGIIKSGQEKGHLVEVMPPDTDWNFINLENN